MSKKSVRFNDDVKVYVLPDEDRRFDMRELFAQLRLKAQQQNETLTDSEEEEEDEDTYESEEDDDGEEDEEDGADDDLEDDDDLEIVFSDE